MTNNSWKRLVTAFFRRISLFPRCETTTRNRVPSKEKVYLYHMNILDFRAGNRIVVSQPPPACAHMFARNSRSSLTIRAGARLSAIIIYIYIYACRFGTCASLTSSERVQQRYIAENVVRARARVYARGARGCPIVVVRYAHAQMCQGQASVAKKPCTTTQPGPHFVTPPCRCTFRIV